MTLAPCCAWFEAEGALALRDGLPADLAPELRAALEACPQCQAALAGAGALAARLALWAEPAPPADLIERTLAGLALANAGRQEDEHEPQEGAEGKLEVRKGGLEGDLQAETQVSSTRPRRRTTVIEFLVSAPLSAPPAEAPSRARLALRFGIQAAAAVLLFGISSLFVALYYPAVSHALEERDQVRCQARLATLQQAARRYRSEHPQGPALVGFELRAELIRGGYANELDFVCPSHRGQELGQRSYVGELPAGVAELSSGRPLFWDRFGNHSSGFNLVRVDGRLDHVPEEGLTSWRLRQAPGGEAPR